MVLERSQVLSDRLNPGNCARVCCMCVTLLPTTLAGRNTAARMSMVAAADTTQVRSQGLKCTVLCLWLHSSSHISVEVNSCSSRSNIDSELETDKIE